MHPKTRMRAGLAALVFIMTNAVLFGAGLITVLSIPAWQSDAAYTIPAVVVASFVVAAPASWIIAPRLRARYWRQRAAEREHTAAMPHM
jgi:hypothetical protein